MATIFVTGFPGFLGSLLVPRLLERDEGTRAACLVQPKFASMARERAADLAAAHPALEGRIDLVEGDLTRPGLGIEHAAVADDVNAIYHFAAVYDLAVARDLAMRVNVDGTKNMLKFAAECGSLDRFHYVSTCYVSGRHPGLFKESDLDLGQAFNNFYEETKFLAEVEVQNAIGDGLPAVVYRPTIVVGDSRTGATRKYDGPYPLIRWVLRQPGRFALMPVVGNPDACKVYVVPSDFVVDAIEAISAVASRGTVYQLADPEPPTVTEVTDLLGEALAKRIVRVRLPLRFTRAALGLPGVRKVAQVPPETLDYMAYPVEYDSTNAQAALAGTGVACPPLRSYLDKLVEFTRAHPEVARAGLS